MTDELPPLTLNPERRYIQGPPAKADYLLRHGAREITHHGGPLFPPPEGVALVAVVENPGWEAALWVQDSFDFQRCKRADDRIVRWFHMEAERLASAPNWRPTDAG